MSGRVGQRCRGATNAHWTVTSTQNTQRHNPRAIQGPNQWITMPVGMLARGITYITKPP
jgi:hypothetical protein